MAFALKAASVFMLGDLRISVAASEAECALGNLGPGHSSTSLLQTSMKMQKQPSHDMAAAPSSTRILDTYNACHAQTYPFLSQGEVIEHPASETHFIHIDMNAGTSVQDSTATIGSFKLHGWSTESDPGDDITSFVGNGTFFTTALVRDPLERSLSAFHSAWKRAHCMPLIGDCITSGCELCHQEKDSPEETRKYIEHFKEMLLKLRTPQSTLEKEPTLRNLLPQMSFLLHPDGSKAALDYIGSMEAPDGLEKEFKFMFDTQVPLTHSTAGSKVDVNLFRIERSSLPTDVLVEVCNTYQVDYCCFGYDFPDACKAAGFSCDVQH